MIKKFDQYNESLRDKMTPVSEEDIKKKLGEEKYHIYRTVQDAKDSIKQPFEFSQFTTGSADDKNIGVFAIRLRFIRFIFSYNGENWKYFYDYNGPSDPMFFDSWDEVYKQIILDANKSFNKEIIQHQKEVNRHQETIDGIKKEMEKISNDKEI